MVITAPSDPRGWALSPVQHAFLDELPQATTVRVNFPYREPTAPWRPTPVWLASVRHVGHWFRRRRMASRHRDQVISVLQRAEISVVLANSMGLELLGQLRLPAELLDRMRVFSTGGFATTPPECLIERVCSRRDWVARRFPADHWVDSDHLSYLIQPEVLALARDFVHRALDEVTSLP